MVDDVVKLVTPSASVADDVVKAVVDSGKTTTGTKPPLKVDLQFFADKGDDAAKSINTSDIRYTQDSTSKNFSNGGNAVDDLVSGLKSGDIDPKSIQEIRIFEKDGIIHSLDNRQLYAFKEAGIENINYRWATEKEILEESWKMTTKDGGLSIIVRGK
ncbi:hypothetical protein [Enterococcus sp. CWB-B31]|uniref:hypothetical protein n=1 Tax=Enterococcus sp. CWB-B31 TaxID=2885159 RepID=UPI001E4E5901|nr:hypothetical protein [Enterococcus sp. CWB-B31]MCB5955160.1 hypothetical protein [Enterococcus sp. CWB-B31]